MQNTTNYKAHPMDADRRCLGKSEKQHDLGYDYTGCPETLCTGMFLFFLDWHDIEKILKE